MKAELPRVEPGETRALIAPDGNTVTLLYRHQLSVDPKPHVLVVPTDTLLLLVCQAVVIQAQAQSGIQTPNVLPGTGGMPPNH